MTIEHHPTDSMLAAFAAGTLDHGQHVAIATHLVSCPQCRTFMRSMEQVGGEVLTGLPPAAMSNDAFATVEARLNEPVTAASAADTATTVPETEVPGLPEFVRRYRFGHWKWIAPSVHLRPIMLPYASDTRVFLLQVRPWDQDARAHSHRDRDDLRAVRSVQPGWWPLWARRFRPG